MTFPALPVLARPVALAGLLAPALVLASLLVATLPARAQSDAMQDADDQICAFARQAGTGLDGIVETFRQQSDRFPAAARDGLIGQITAQLRDYEFTRADVYKVYDLPGYTRVYVVPAATNGKMIFFVLAYELYAGKVALTNFQYADKLEDALKLPYASDPVAVSCPY